MAQGYRSSFRRVNADVQHRKEEDVGRSGVIPPKQRRFESIHVRIGIRRTGASGYPVISQLIKNKAPKAKVGGALLLPYFRLPDPKNLIQQQENLKKSAARLEQLHGECKTACEFYYKNFESVDSNYVLGDDLDNCEQYEKYAIGSKEQENDAHMIELFAAYAAIDFWEKKDNNYKKFYRIQVNNPKKGQTPDFSIIGNDLPDILEKRGRVYPYERFALFCHYLDEIWDLTEKQSAGLLNKITWLRNNGRRGRDVMAAKAELQPLKEFCDCFRVWIYQNHRNKAPLAILDENMRLECLLRDDQDRYRKQPISKLDTKLCGGKASGGNITEILLRAASRTEITREGVK